MDDALLIILLAALFLLGFIPVVMLGRFFNRTRRDVVETPKGVRKTPAGKDADHLAEFDRTGVTHFDREDDAEHLAEFERTGVMRFDREPEPPQDNASGLE